jgi:hypothetical protein
MIGQRTWRRAPVIVAFARRINSKRRGLKELIDYIIL